MRVKRAIKSWRSFVCLSVCFFRSRGRTCPSSLAQTTQQTDYKGPACIVTRKKSDYVLITITGRNVLNTKNFDLPEVRTATRSSWQALFQGTLSPLPREARHVFFSYSLHKALTSQNACGNITKTTSGWYPDYRSQSSKLSILTSLWDSVSM